MENFDNVYTVEMNGPKGWEVIFTTVSSQQALNEFCRCDSEDDGYLYRLTSMLSHAGQNRAVLNSLDDPEDDSYSLSDYAERNLRGE